MSRFRIALANLQYPPSPEHSVALAEGAIRQASMDHVDIVSETVRWAASRGAHVVFHPHFDEAEPGAYRPVTFADPRNSFHEKAILCRAAENTCFFASVNCASEGSPTTSAIVKPDGTLLSHQPYGERGLLIADIDTADATGLLAKRHRSL